MRANEIPRDELEMFVESDEGKAFTNELDKAWADCMSIAMRNGFIVAAAGGTAALSTYSSAREAGIEIVVKMLQMSGVEVPLGE